jgi:DNA (cytosine-5)-methyltransferase 1
MGARRDQRANLLLCGSMFGLPITRHRLFECSWWVPQPEHPKCSGIAKKFAAAKGWDYRDMSCTGKGRRKGTAERWKEILGLTGTMTQQEIAESIPPAFTLYIGQQFLRTHFPIH